MASWKKTITFPFRKAVTFFNQQPRDQKKTQPGTFNYIVILVATYFLCMQKITIHVMYN